VLVVVLGLQADQKLSCWALSQHTPVRLGLAEYLHQTIGDRFTPPQILRDKVAAGALGRKSGMGFYDWE
jgi:hypothetical protein